MKVLATICLLLVQQDVAATPDTAILPGEQAVLSAYKRMEEADQKGDGQLWLSLSDRKTQDTMNQALLSALAANPSISLGQAIQLAKSGITDNDVRRTWILFGDPGMRIPFPAAPSKSTTRFNRQ